MTESPGGLSSALTWVIAREKDPVDGGFAVRLKPMWLS